MSQVHCQIPLHTYGRCRYDEIRKIYVEQLAFIWVEDSTTENTRTRVEKRVCSFVEGDIDHAVETLAALWEIASNDEDVTSPANTPLVVSSFLFCLLPAFTLRWSFCATRLRRSRAPLIGSS